MPRLTRSWIWLIAAIFVATCSSAASANSQESTPPDSDLPPLSGTPAVSEAPKFDVHPVGDYENPWFDLTLAPGESRELTAEVRNFGTVPSSLHVFTTNAINTPNGGFAADETDAELTGTALWIDFPEQKLALDPGESKKVNLTVSIPADTPAGFYVAALVAETTESLEIHGTDAFRQFIRSAMSVEITVPGEMTSGFELGEPALTPVGQQWMLNIPIINTGTARLRPRGELILSTPDGTEISSSLVEMGSFYGGSTTSVRVLLPAQLPYGEYLVSLTLTDEETGATDAIQSAQISLVDPGVADETIFVVEDASVTPNGDPIRYADISATITNNGPTISTANITLNVFRDGEEIESYPLAQNQALPQGTTEFSQRYIPLDDWQSGTWTFELVIASVDGGTETILATIDVEDQIVVP